jgi:hypothetical protein
MFQVPFKIAPVPAKIAKPFVTQLHYTKGIMKSPVCIGLIVEEELRAVAAFASPMSEAVRAWPWGPDARHHVTELHRLACAPLSDWEDRPPNVLSWFLVRALQEFVTIRPLIKGVVSYADSTQGHVGSIYRAANALYFGTVRGAGKSYLDEEGRLHPPRYCGVNLTDADAALRGWTPVKSKEKHRYLFLTSSEETKSLRKRDKAAWLKKLIPTPISWQAAPNEALDV